jgi:hypothetical protein
MNEDDLPLSEWLKQNGITKFDHLSDIDNFIHADNDLMTSRIPTESDIIDTILNKEDSDEDNVEFVEDTISTKSVPTYSQAQDAVEILIDIFENSDTSGGVFDALSAINGNLRDLQVKSFKHCTILNYLGMCKRGEVSNDACVSNVLYGYICFNFYYVNTCMFYVHGYYE